LLLFFSPIVIRIAFSSCPPAYDGPTEDACFKVSSVAATFVQCQESVCALDGGALASLRTKTEYEFVKAMLDEKDVGAFVGLFEYRSNEWLNVDGSPLAYMNWAPGQPDNWCLDEDVAFLYPDVWPGGLIDVSAGVISFCVCRAGESPSSAYLASASKLSTADADYDQCGDEEEEDRQEDEIIKKVDAIQHELVALLTLVILIFIALVVALAFALTRHLHTIRTLSNLSSEPIPAYGLELNGSGANSMDPAVSISLASPYDNLVSTGGRGAV